MTKSCNNCREKGHEKDTCPYRCWKCDAEIPFDPVTNKRMYHKCEVPEFRAGAYDKQYHRVKATFRLLTMPDTYDLLRADFAASLQRNSTVYLRRGDFAIIDSPEKSSEHRNRLMLPEDFAAYSLNTLAMICKDFIAEKLRNFENKRFYDPRMQVRVFSSLVTVVLPKNAINQDLLGLLLELSRGASSSSCWFRLSYSDTRFDANFSDMVDIDNFYEFDFYCEGIPHDEDGICRESISISFDFGYRSLARDIKQSETMIKREEFVKPEWVRRQMFDFNAPIGNLQLPGVNRNEVEQSFVEFLNGFEVDWTKLDDSQREALIGMTMNSGFGLIGPPGTGKSQMLAYFAVHEVVDNNKTILVLTSRNRSAEDVADKIYEAAEEYFSNQGRSVPGNFMTRRYPKTHTRFGVSNKKIASRSGKQRKKPLGPPLSSFKIVVSTIGHSSHPNFASYQPDVLIIDEAALADSLEIFSTIGRQVAFVEDPEHEVLDSHYSSLEKVILVGDVYQMLPRFTNVEIFTDKAMFDSGLSISPLFRFVRNGGPTVTLTHCRRGPAPIFQWNFDRFYVNKGVYADQESNTGVYIDTKALGYPSFNAFKPLVQKRSLLQSVFIDGLPNSMCKVKSGSIHNPTNREIAANLIKLLLICGSTYKNGECTRENIAQRDIIYITFYKVQSVLMRRLLKEMKLDKIRVMTVDQCQGIQAPIVITDSVRSDGKVGFMEGRSKGHFQWKQNGRFNVGTTRPRITRFHIGYVENMLPKYGDSDLKNFADYHKSPPQNYQGNIAYLKLGNSG